MWSCVPLFTLGFGTLPTTAYGAVRLRNRWQLASLPVYAVAASGLFLFGPGDGLSNNAAYGLCLCTGWIGGTAHAFAIRARVFGLEPRPDSLRGQQESALRALHEKEAARATARALLTRSPDEARALGIGRPDLAHRTYPDGGLVDVNAVDAETLATSLAMPSVQAERIVALRSRVDRFEDYGDLVMLMDSDGSDLDRYRDQMIFLPKA